MFRYFLYLALMVLIIFAIGVCIIVYCITMINTTIIKLLNHQCCFLFYHAYIIIITTSKLTTIKFELYSLYFISRDYIQTNTETYVGYKKKKIIII